MKDNRSKKVRVWWTKPRGTFSKYSLQLVLLNNLASNRLLSIRAKKDEEVWLPKDSLEHVVGNLQPGEMYRVELRTMASDSERCLEEKVPKEMFLTQPLPPSNVSRALVCYQL